MLLRLSCPCFPACFRFGVLSLWKENFNTQNINTQNYYLSILASMLRLFSNTRNKNNINIDHEIVTKRARYIQTLETAFFTHTTIQLVI